MGAQLVRSRRLEAEATIRHGFTQRSGGVSVGPRASLHLAVRDGDVESDIVRNWERALAPLQARPTALALLTQVHGAEVVWVREPGGPVRSVAEADGAVTDVPGVVLAVRTADCVPVLFAAPGAVGVAHAGWRGLVAGVLQATVRQLCEVAGCEPGAITAAIGPHAGAAAYEVGPDVIDALVGAGLARARVAQPGPRGRDHARLGVATRDLLAKAGVHDVDDVDLCTMTDRRFFSHRRDGAETGRQAALVTRLAR
jgi:YfiH family protein